MHIKNWHEKKDVFVKTTLEKLLQYSSLKIFIAEGGNKQEQENQYAHNENLFCEVVSLAQIDNRSNLAQDIQAK